MKIILKGERPMSWNTLYAGKHWGVRDAEANRTHVLVRNMLRTMGIKPQKQLYDVPVTIALNAYFDSRPLDPDNICGKFYIDGLKEYLLRDDSHKYVNQVRYASLIDRNNPRIEIDIE